MDRKSFFRVPRPPPTPKVSASRPKQPLDLSKPQLVKLRYVEHFNGNATSTASILQQFNPTSLFDPDQTGTGHQPLGFDEYMLFYEYYAVKRARMQLHAVQDGAANSGTGGIDLCLALAARSVGTPSMQFELPTSKTTQVGFNAGSRKLDLNYDAKKFFHSSALENQDLWGTISTSPNFAPEASFNVAVVTSAGGTVNANYMAIIDYEVYFMGRKNIAPS